MNQESHKIDTSWGNLVEDHVAQEPMLECRTNWFEVKRMTMSTMTPLINKLDTWIAKRFEKLLFAMMQSLEKDSNLPFVQRVL